MERFRAMSPAEFFKRNRYIAGFQNTVRAVYQTVKELVENALDATEPYRILPNIRLYIDYVDKDRGFIKITCSDNGIGIPAREVPNAFGRVLYGSKYIERQSRGVFGLGVKMAVLYSQMTTGQPVEVTTKYIRDTKKYFFKIKIDAKKNIPVVIEKKVYETNNNNNHGTTVSLVIEGDWGRARSKVLEYIKRTHVLCPYVYFYVKYPDRKEKTLILRRASEKLPQPPKPIKPHPYGIDIDTFRHLISEEKPGVSLLKFLTKHFSGVGVKSAKQFLKSINISYRRSVKGLSNDEIVKIAHGMKKYKWRPPPASALSPVGVENIRIGLEAVFHPEFSTAVTRSPRAYSGHPFIVEVGIAYGGRIQPVDKPLLLRFANKIPLLYDEGVDVSTATVEEIDWKSYKVEFPAPIVVLTHVASTKIPYHTLGKEAIADVPEIRNELKLAIQECGRRLRQYLSKKEKQEMKLRKAIAISKYFPTLSETIASITGDKPDFLLDSLNKLLENNLEVVKE